tara:strand:+ start:127 stop:552 length:426 start_codon:yes stop_codon:yes gene_type:complete
VYRKRDLVCKWWLLPFFILFLCIVTILRLPITLWNWWYLKETSYYRAVFLKDLCTEFDYSMTQSIEELMKENEYDWDKLEKSIKKYGVLRPPIVRACNDIGARGNKCTYYVCGGNHRVAVLRKLYGLDAPIIVKVYIKNVR